MTQSATCKKITSMLSMYIDNKLDNETAQFVKAHLEVCPQCYEKYKMLKKLIAELRTAYRDLQNDTNAHEKNRQFSIKEYENFHNNLSAYFDNELSLNESVNMKKYMIKFPNARKELEDLYDLHKAILYSFTGTKKLMGEDYSKIISYQISGKNPNHKKHFTVKVASFVGALILLGALISATTPIGEIVREKGIMLFKKTLYVQSQIDHELATDLMQ